MPSLAHDTEVRGQVRCLTGHQNGIPGGAARAIWIAGA